MANDFSQDANCKALWNFESGAVPFLADSKGGNTLTNSGVDEDTSDYKQGSCSAGLIRFNSDYLDITNANLDSGFPLKSGESNKTFSLAFWVKFDAINVGQNIIGFPPSGSGLLSFLVTLNEFGTDGKLYLHLSSNGTSWTESLFHATALTTGRWYHVGITYDNSDYSVRIRIWDDTAGAIHGTDKTSTEDDISIGAGILTLSWSTLTSALGGNLDEMVVFNDVLTTDEIDAIRAGTYGDEAPGNAGIMTTNTGCWGATY